MVDTVDYDDSELRNLINELEKNQENLKTQLDLLTGGGWATREDLEDLKHILGAQKEDYYEADQGLRLLIANIDKRLNAIDIPDIDPWTQKITELNNDVLNVKNIANQIPGLFVLFLFVTIITIISGTFHLLNQGRKNRNKSSRQSS